MMTRWTLITLFAAATLTACTATDGPSTEVQTRGGTLAGDFSEAVVASDIPILGASLQGTISDVEVAHHATAVTASLDGPGAEIVVIADTRSEGVGMAQINLEDLSVLTDPTAPVDGISIIACSGVVPGDWTFDGNAENVTLTIAPGADDPNTVTVSFTADIVEFDDFFHPDEDGYALASDAERAAIPVTQLSGSVTLSVPSPKE